MRSLPTFHHSLFRYEPEFRRFSADMSDLEHSVNYEEFEFQDLSNGVFIEGKEETVFFKLLHIDRGPNGEDIQLYHFGNLEHNVTLVIYND